MHFCYPDPANTFVNRWVALLACHEFLPISAQQLANTLHFLADSQTQPKLNINTVIRQGSTVELENGQTGLRGWLKLVAPAHACYRSGRISLLSPLGSAMLGKTVNTDIHLSLLCHPLHFRVLTILHVQHGKIRSL
ncbi:GreA/GreB family elongation factor [Rheinheimera sp. UJ63]|uniref:GreA/GreB family elongation factor n=1 Tax=Rheinheimera sp. UJ63 TaxID=2910157 RepID=UPI001F3A500E|nr:GreA/GreB family elongation factor [Rheinheimera sp. UJ63]MCF4007843.1 GreA/GreB family elongation factor [Rheinheimera sp. UJ63]